MLRGKNIVGSVINGEFINYDCSNGLRSPYIHKCTALVYLRITSFVAQYAKYSDAFS